jgi:3-hydroxyacyl-CoA dehydrogenase
MAANDTPVSCVAIVGCGVIGASWTAHYLARGFEVVTTDPARREVYGALEERLTVKALRRIQY